MLSTIEERKTSQECETTLTSYFDNLEEKKLKKIGKKLEKIGKSWKKKSEKKLGKRLKSVGKQFEKAGKKLKNKF